ncbi:hypothetical protein IAR55_003124 [Kwoniella newhampshirensis]|uniref:Cell division cycle protein 123 n=1 Tax=Kwoniella newhampshirensis TaxID=1651941 RepID=A0AAW0Z0D6_9TREE
MPIPTPPAISFDLFPTLTRAQIDAARTSAWYDTFEDLTFPAIVIDVASLGEDEAFIHWLESDSIFLPEGSEGLNPPSASLTAVEEEDTAISGRPRVSSSASDGSSSSSSSSSEAPVYRLPALNEAIRDALRSYGGAVFPKLNWTSPKDAAFILPQTSSGPLHCQSPSDVYLLLKSSDFISHDMDPERAYGEPEGERPKIELVLKRFEDINPAREVRCFVRNNALIGITQRDLNYYDHLQSEETRSQICDTVRALWEDEIRENYGGGDLVDVFDLYLSPKSASAKIIDFQPYRPSTDPLLFTYDELLDIVESAFEPIPRGEADDRPRLPIFRIIESRAHPEANRNAPAYQTNMMPLEMIEMGEGRNMAEFKEAWEEAVAAGMAE